MPQHARIQADRFVTGVGRLRGIAESRGKTLADLLEVLKRSNNIQIARRYLGPSDATAGFRRSPIEDGRSKAKFSVPKAMGQGLSPKTLAIAMATSV